MDPDKNNDTAKQPDKGNVSFMGRLGRDFFLGCVAFLPLALFIFLFSVSYTHLGGSRMPAEFYVVVRYRRVAFGAHAFDDLFHRREYARVLREIFCFGFFIVSHIDHSVVIQLLW